MSQSETNRTVSVPDQLQMASERTFLAHERTLLAWVRTGTSLVTFGITMYKFFEFLHEQESDKQRPHFFGARPMGLALVIIGIATLAMACWQHRQRTRFLRTIEPALSFSPAYTLAALMSLLGFLALLSAMMNE